MPSKFQGKIFVAVLLAALLASWFLYLGLNRLLIVDRYIFELPNTINSDLTESWTDDLEIPGIKVRSSHRDFTLYSVRFRQRLSTDGRTAIVVPSSVQFKLRYRRVVPAVLVSLVLWFALSCIIVNRGHRNQSSGALGSN